MSGTLRGIVLLMLLIVCGGMTQTPVAARQPGNTGTDGGSGAERRAGAGAGSSGRETPVLSVDFGPGNSNLLWPGRWGPITLTLTGGSKPFTGAVSIDFFQDGKPGGVVRRPVSSTPGKQTTIPVMINPGQGCQHIGITLVDQSGRQVDRKIYDSTANSGPDQYPLPLFTHTAFAVVMGVGEPTGAARSVLQSVNASHGLSAYNTVHIKPVGVDGSKLATSWTGYDSLLLLALDAEIISKADPRAIAAIREWVSSGGRLVLFVNQPGTKWRQWLGGTDASGAAPGGLFTVDEPTGGAVPAELAGEIRKPLAQFETEKMRALRNLQEDAQEVTADGVAVVHPEALPDPAVDSDSVVPVKPPAGDGPDGSSDPSASRPQTPSPLVPDVSAELPRRLIRLTDAGVRAGWTTRWELNTSSGQGTTGGTGGAKEGLLAEGPYGFGWVVVVGVDPNLATTTQSPQAICAMWTSLTDRALADWKGQFTSPTPKGRTTVLGWDASLAGHETDAAKAKMNVLERLAQVPTIGNGVFYALAAALFVLALFLGPIDALALRKLRARQWSWATSLTWIAIASVAAMYIPMFLRSGPTKVNRVSVIDVIASSGPGTQSGFAPLAWRTSYTGVYASSTGTRAFTSDAPGAWWRSVSAQTYLSYSGRDSQRSGPITASVQMLPDFSALDPSDPWAGMSLSAGRSDGNQLTPSVYKIWTFRAFTDQARVQPTIGASLAPLAGGQPNEWSLRLMGIPEAAKVNNAAVKVGGLWHEVLLQPSDASTTPSGGSNATTRVAKVVPKADTEALEEIWSPGWEPKYMKSANYRGNYGGYGSQDPLKHPGQLLALPGADRRGMVLDDFFAKAASSHEWAVVYLELTDMPSDVTFGDDTQYSHNVVMRILVRVGDAGAAPQAPTSDSKNGTADDKKPADNEPADHHGSGGTP